jgi:hypothetical protein
LMLISFSWLAQAFFLHSFHLLLCHLISVITCVWRVPSHIYYIKRAVRITILRRGLLARKGFHLMTNYTIPAHDYGMLVGLLWSFRRLLFFSFHTIELRHQHWSSYQCFHSQVYQAFCFWFYWLQW